MRRIGWTLIGWILVFSPSTRQLGCADDTRQPLQEVNYKDIFVRERGNTVEFGNARLMLRIETGNGDWISLLSNGISEDILDTEDAVPSTDFQIDGVWMINRHGANCMKIEPIVQEVEDCVVLQVISGVCVHDSEEKSTPAHYDFELTTHYRLYPERGRIDRWARLLSIRNTEASNSESNPTGNAKQMEGFSFQVPGALIGNSRDCLVDVPGPFFPNTYIPANSPYDSLKDRDYSLHSAPDAGFGLVIVSNPSRKLALGSWMDTGGEVAYHTYLLSDGQRMTLRHQDHRSYRIDRQAEIVSDTHRVELVSSRADVLTSYRQMIGERFPPESHAPAWVKDMILLEVYPKYYEGGFKGIAARLPAYREIGFNTLYLMPHWLGGYSPIDPLAIDSAYGTEEDLKELVRTAHQLGMHVLFDMVIHGFNKKSPLPVEHPEYFVHDEQGNLVLHRTWQSITCDWASPAYQQYMSDLVIHDVEKYDIDGYRVDAATYKSPNWDPRIPYPAYKSGTAAPELLGKMLQSLRTRKPEAILLSEVFGPLYYTVCDLVHDNQTEAVEFLLEKMEKGEINAEHYKQHLANVYDCLPPGIPRIFYARNHDTSWFYHFHGYSPRFMAMEAIHAFFGIPSIFAGDPKNAPHPDSDPATYEYYKKLFSQKMKMPELRYGEIVLRDIHCDNSWVFAGIRHFENRSVLAVVSLSDKNESVRVTLPANFLSKKGDKTIVLTDVIQGADSTSGTMDRSAGVVQFTMKPFQVLIGRF